MFCFTHPQKHTGVNLGKGEAMEGRRERQSKVEHERGDDGGWGSEEVRLHTQTDTHYYTNNQQNA